MMGFKAYHLGDIHFTLAQFNLNMQWVSLVYLKSLVADTALQPEGVKPDAYSHTRATLIMFISDEEHQGIQHVHIGLVV